MVYYVEKLFVPRLLFNPIFMCINRNNSTHSFTSIGYELITACVYCYEIICAIPHQQLASHTSKAKKSSTSRSNNKNSINNNLNLSRSIGDLKYKQVKDRLPSEQLISVHPDVFEIDLHEDEDEFMVMACDGVWDVMTNTAICEFIRERLTKYNTCGEKSMLFDENGNMKESQEVVNSHMSKHSSSKSLNEKDIDDINEMFNENVTLDEMNIIDSSSNSSTSTDVVTKNEDVTVISATTTTTCNTTDKENSCTNNIYPIKSIVTDVLTYCLADNIRENCIGSDNMTCIIVVFDSFLKRIRNNDPSIRINTELEQQQWADNDKEFVEDVAEM